MLPNSWVHFEYNNFSGGFLGSWDIHARRELIRVLNLNKLKTVELMDGVCCLNLDYRTEWTKKVEKTAKKAFHICNSFLLYYFYFIAQLSLII